MFSSNIYNSKDSTYHDLISLIKNKGIKVLEGDKDSSIIIMDSKKYYAKLETMVNEDIKNGICKETTDTTLHDLKVFQDFLYGNCKDYKDYKKMRQVSNSPERIYASAKTDKFDDINEISTYYGPNGNLYMKCCTSNI